MYPWISHKNINSKLAFTDGEAKWGKYFPINGLYNSISSMVHSRQHSMDCVVSMAAAALGKWFMETTSPKSDNCQKCMVVDNLAIIICFGG